MSIQQPSNYGTAAAYKVKQSCQFRVNLHFLHQIANHQNARRCEPPPGVHQGAGEADSGRVSGQRDRQGQPAALETQVRAGALRQADQVHRGLQQEERRHHGQEDLGVPSCSCEAPQTQVFLIFFNNDRLKKLYNV